MKKYRFALQVFILVSMLPICVVLQIQHATGRLQKNGPDVMTNEKEISSPVINLK